MQYKKSSWGLFDPKGKTPFRLSRSKIDMFVQCPRCFYFDRRLGVRRPSMPGFSLNMAVDELLKKEFDIHRAKREPHPLMKKYGVKAVPFEYEKMDEWRDALRGGVTYVHPETNLMLTGGVDDVWVDDKGELLVVDYKATSTRAEITLDGEYKEGYKRQMEFYQWLLRRNGFLVSDTGYFVYVNADKDKQAFDAKLDFGVQLIAYTGKDDWVEQMVIKAYKVLMGNRSPESGDNCEFCGYRVAFRETEEGLLVERKN